MVEVISTGEKEFGMYSLVEISRILEEACIYVVLLTL